VGTVVPRASGGLVWAGDHGIYVMDEHTGVSTLICDPEKGIATNRFNDGKCDPAGRFWAGTMAVSEAPGCGSLYCLGTTLGVSSRVTGVSVSNGLAWSHDAKTMYYVDSPERCVVAYDFDVATGAIDRPRTVYDVPEGWGFPDGMALDADGCLWVALWDGFRVLRIDPAGRRMVDWIEMPVARPTSCAFGGAALDELYITSASINLTAEQRAAQPHAGGVFVCRTGVVGLPASEFGGTAELERLFTSAPD
jgi:sugar lactone lactonase YvrE